MGLGGLVGLVGLVGFMGVMGKVGSNYVIQTLLRTTKLFLLEIVRSGDATASPLLRSQSFGESLLEGDTLWNEITANQALHSAKRT